ncbi:MAG: alpha amylase C-terminal domain-containing protein, partial [Clostridia bacterium]|nr:alpha amylase C-terminal domain-containing protein [Clostridia bacterium]
EWIPNENGGNQNLQAIAFLKKLNSVVFGKFKNALMIAEESTAFPLVTKPVDIGGLGFNYKWNMGWMNDVLSYMSCDPYFRSGCHNKLTFSMYYAFSENFVLPISHDEVVHGKRSLIDKMPGDIETKFANLRAFNLYMFAHPGKKLNFMGNEFGQFKEWNYKEGLEFFMLDFPLHKKLFEFNKNLNRIYADTPAFYEIEDGWQGFRWISADESNNNVIAFERFDKSGNSVVVIVNFSGNEYTKYRLGVDKGEYSVLISSDDKKFGGNGKVAKKTYKAVRKTAHFRDYSIMLDLPAFTGIYFVKKT